MRRTRARSDTGGRGFLDPKALQRIDNLELVARTVVDGFIQGLHRSPYLGLSLDFAEHRPYMPGDDPRRIDWRLYARTDRYYLKLFEAETNSNFNVLLDVSKSMEYGSAGISKLDYGRYLAASLAYFSHRQRDRVGCVLFDEAIIDRVPPSAKHLDLVLQAIARAEPRRRGSLGPPLRASMEFLKRRGVVVLISDFYEEPEAAVDAVKGLRYLGNDVIVFHVLDPTETTFSFERAATFQDLESGDQMPVIPEDLQERYRKLVEEHTNALGRLFIENRIDYALFDTATPLDFALFSYLSSRQRLQRVR